MKVRGKMARQSEDAPSDNLNLDGRYLNSLHFASSALVCAWVLMLAPGGGSSGRDFDNFPKYEKDLEEVRHIFLLYELCNSIKFIASCIRD